MSQSTSSRPPGFTLIEVLVTLVIIAIVAALSAPAILSMAPNMALKSAAQDLYSNIQEAKILAIKQNKSVTITVTPGTSYTIWEPFIDTNLNGTYDALPAPGESYTDLDGNGAFSATKTIVFADKYGYGTTDGTGNATKDWNDVDCVQAPRITFDSRGLALNQNGTIYIEHRDNDISYAVTVNVTGAVKIRKYPGTLPFSKDNWE